MQRVFFITELVDGLIAELERQEYSSSRLSGFRTALRKLLSYAIANSVVDYSVDFGQRFLTEQYPHERESLIRDLPSETRAGLRAIALLDDFYVHGIVTRKRRTYSYEGLTCDERILLSNFREHAEDLTFNNIAIISSSTNTLAAFVIEKRKECFIALLKIIPKTEMKASQFPKKP